MNLEFVKQVGRDNPTWLPTNIGATCFAHTVELVRRCRAAGGAAFLIVKTDRDGAQYAPPGFVRSTIKGTDGNDYTHTGFSHDAIWLDGVQFDTLTSANHFDRTIYKRQGEPNWSFDPTDGPQIVAGPAWESIPAQHWRPHNPPFRGELGAPGNPGAPQPAPRPSNAPGREEMMNAGKWLDSFYRSPDGLQREHGLIKFTDRGPEPDYEGLGAWLFDVYWNARLAGKLDSEARSVVMAEIRKTDEWKARHP